MTIPNTTYRVLVEKLGATNAEEFIGNEGEVFYDPNTPALKLSDGTTIGGISISEGATETSGALTINSFEENQYTLQLADAGKAILLNGQDLYVPSDSAVNFPIGSIITIIVSENTSFVATEGNDSSVILAGTEGQSVSWWAIPSYNIATLIKVVSNGWLLSGPGIYED